MLPAITAAALAITMNGRPVTPAPHALVRAGTTYLPVRDIGRALGADVHYDAVKHAVVATYHGTSSSISLATEGRRFPVIGGHVYAPLRALASIFHIAVAYDGTARTIALTDATAEIPSYAHAPNASTVVQPAIVRPTFPQNGAQVNDSYPAISALIATQGGPDVDPGSIHVRIDGNDVSANASLIGDQIVYTPTTPLANGPHTVYIDGTDRAGVPFSGEWSFTSTYTAPNMSSSGPPAGSFGGLQSVYIDRAVGAGDRYFDIVAYGPPGGYGTVTIDGVPGIYNLVPYGANRYVAHVTLPIGINEPFARANVHFTGAGGQQSDFTLPTTFQIYTIYRGRQFAPPPAAPPQPVPTATLDPGIPRRGVPRPTPAPIVHRVPLSNATATPRPVLTPLPVTPITPMPLRTPPSQKRRILGTPRPIPTPIPKPAATP